MAKELILVEYILCWAVAGHLLYFIRFGFLICKHKETGFYHPGKGHPITMGFTVGFS